MSSLRVRLSALVSFVALAVTAVASLAISVERWQEETRSLPEQVSLAAFQLSEQSGLSELSPRIEQGVDVFVNAFDDQGAILGQSGSAPPELEEAILEDIWLAATEQDVIIPAEYSVDGRVVFVAGIACTDLDRCDTVVVGASEESLLPFLVDRLPWLIGPALGVAVAALIAARWVVARSLRPVDDMRRELEAITASDLDRRVPVPETGDELQHLGRAMNQTIDRLGAAVTANERFVADAAHELRSPITGVRAALEIEAAKAPGSLVADSAKELDRAARLIEDLLVLARRQGGPTRRSELDFDDIVRAELGNTRARFSTITFDEHIEAVRLTADGDSLHRVVANLLENACHYGDRRVAVALRSERVGCSLTIEDDGPGIPLADRERVFERFTRLDESRSRVTGGSGLGLAIVREIVADHGGTVEVGDSELGGAGFRLTL